MNPQRVAWVELVAGLAAAIAYAVLFRLAGAGPALVSLSLLAAPSLILAPGRRRRVLERDERDVAIMQAASLAGYTAFWLVFVGASLMIWFVRKGAGTVTVDWIPLFPFGGWIVLTVARSTAVLVHYARGR